MSFLTEFRNYLFSQKNPSSKATVKNYLSDVSRFIKWLAQQNPTGKVEFEPSLVTPEIIEQFRESSSLTTSSLERNLSSLRKFFHFLVLEGVISQSPFKPITHNPSPITDPYRLREFKDYLYVYNASGLTIKNYLMDIRNFLKWAKEVTVPENAWDIKEKDVLGKIDSNLLLEYKRRLPYSPRTINRKLSSMRKYLAWAREKGYINQTSNTELQIPNYRVKTQSLPLTKPAENWEPSGFSRNLTFIPDLILVNPLTSLVRKVELLKWKLQGKPVFTEAKSHLPAQAGKIKVKNFPKEVFAPLEISTVNFPIHKKVLFALAHNRPKWYKSYHSYPISHYLHFAVLILFMSFIGFGIYQSLNAKSNQQSVLGTNLTNPPVPRILSFQGKLTDNFDNPITNATALRFAIYDSLTGTGSALKWQEVDTVTPDSDGIFNVLLGNNSSLTQDLFANHAGLWLGVTVGTTPELTPRQQLATVAFAENSETLQGLPPITQTGASTSNVVLALDSSGNLTIGGTATPTFQATGGQFTLSGNTLLLTTTAGTNSDLIASPSGLGKIDLNKPIQNTSNNNNLSSALGAVEVDDMLAVLATSSGQSALTINQNSTGPIISASSSGIAKFTVDSSGNTTLGGSLIIAGTTVLGGSLTTVNFGSAGLTTGAIDSSGNFSQTGATTFSTGTGAINLNGAVTAASTLTSTGAFTANGGITDTGNFAQTGSGTFSTGTGAISLNGDVTLASGKSLTTSGQLNLNYLPTSTTDYTLSAKPAATNPTYRWLFSGSTYTDTATMMGGTSDFKYYAYSTPFSGIYLTFATAGLGYNLSAQYSKGAGVWGALTITDGTTNLTTAGSIYFTTPSDWATDTVNGVSGYWIRFSTSTSPTTTAITSANYIEPTGYAIATYLGPADSTPKFYVDYQGNVQVSTAIVAQNLQVTGNVNSNLVPGTNNTYDLGSSAKYWNNAYINTLTANTLSASNTSISGTTSETFTLNSDNNPANPTESITFSRTSSPNPVFSWDATASSFTLNGPLSLSSGTGTATITAPGTINTTGGSIQTNSTTRIDNAGNLSNIGSYTSSDTPAGTTSVDLISGTLTNNTTGGTQRGLVLTLNGSGTTAYGAYVNYSGTGTGTTGIGLGGNWTTGINTNNNSINAGTGTINSGSITIAANDTLSLSGTGYVSNSFSSTTGSAFTTNTTNNGTAGSNTVNAYNVSLTGTANAGGTNILNGVNFVSPSAATNNSFYGLNFATGYTDILRYNSTQIISGTGVLQSAGLSGTYSNALTLSDASNSINGSFNGSIGATTASTGAFTTLSASGLISANGGLTLAANQNLTLNSGTGQIAQTYTGTTTNAAAITANSLTTGNALSLAFTQNAALNAGSTASGLNIAAAAAANSGNTTDLVNLSAGGTGTTNGIEFTGTLGNFTNLIKAGTTFVVNSSGNITAGTYNGDTLSSTALTFSGALPTISASTTNTSLAINANGSGNLELLASGTGNVGINQANPGAELEVDNHVANQIAMLVKGYTSQSADLLDLENSLGTVLAKVDSLGNITGNTLTSTVATGTAPLTIASNTMVANLNAAAAQEPMPNLVLNSDFGRRNSWMTFMPETFADTKGWTGTTMSASGNILTLVSSNAWITAGLSTWKDVRMSAQVQNNPAGGFYAVAKYANTNNYVVADVYAGNFEIRKQIGGVGSTPATVAQTLTSGNWYWLELEAQGTTYIAKLYSSGASPVTKSNATLLQTLTATITDAGVATGQIALQSNQGNSQWGGISASPGGVYVEGWGPESTQVTWEGTVGGQAIGFDESSNAGPLSKQWALRTYIPDASRGIELLLPNNTAAASTISISPSTSYDLSLYEKVSGLGGSGALLWTYLRELGSDGSGITYSGAINDAGETSWTRKTASLTSNASTYAGFVVIGVNWDRNAGTVKSATGTLFVDLAQLEQGSIVTPWRNAPTDDDPIVWNTSAADTPNQNANQDFTTSSATEFSYHYSNGNFFFPWDAGINVTSFASCANTGSAVNPGYVYSTLDTNPVGGVSGNGFYIQGGTAQLISFTMNDKVTAGKHRIAEVGANDGANTMRCYGNTGTTNKPRLIIVATRGKFDLAEEYSVNDPTIGAGDVVSLSSLGGTTIERSTMGYQQNVLGIVSTDPGITLSSQVELNSYQQRPNLRPVALKGRVPVKVTNENGPIHRGDTLTSSATYQGYAMKATKAGPSIGIAMEDFAPVDNGTIQTGKIMTFVNLSWYDPDVYLTSTGDFVINKVEASAPIADVTAATSSATLTATPSAQITNCIENVDQSNFGAVSTSCPPTPLQNITYQISNSLGDAIQRVGVFSELAAANLRAGAINAKDLIAENLIITDKVVSPLAEVKTLRTDTITPLSSNKIVVKLDTSASSASHSGTPSFEIQNASGSAVASITDKGDASFSGQLSAKSASISGNLTTTDATVSGTLKAKNIIADNIDSQILNLKSQLSNLLPKTASSSSITNNQLPITNAIASYSAQLENVDTINAQVGNFSAGLFAVGPTSLSDATVFGQLSVGGTLTLADNSINVLGKDLMIQPLGQGGVSFLSGKVYIDLNGNVEMTGNATVRGTLFAGLISPVPGGDLVFNLGNKGNTGTESAQLLVKNASGSAVLSINNQGDVVSSGSATFSDLLAKTFNIVRTAQADTSLTETVASSSAGFATITAGQVERTIITPFVKQNSLIYLSPASDTLGVTPYIARQTIEDQTLGTKASFTIGIPHIVQSDIKINWWVIN